MPREGQTELLQTEIEIVLSALKGKGSLIDAVREAIFVRPRPNKAEKGLDPPWPSLPILVCEAVGGEVDKAVPAAAATCFFKAAADVFDDIEDADAKDSLSSKYGSAVAVNAATALLFLAEKALTRLAVRQLPDEDILRIIKEVNNDYLNACAGQHLDILSPGNVNASEKQYLKIIMMKTASQIACSCYTGAIIGNGSKTITETFRKFGLNVGMATQIDNDIKGIISGNDIRERKISLPIIYMLAAANEAARKAVTAYFKRDGESKSGVIRMIELCFQTGAMHYAMLKMETYRQEAYAQLLNAKEQGANIKSLEIFIS